MTIELPCFQVGLPTISWIIDETCGDCFNSPTVDQEAIAHDTFYVVFGLEEILPVAVVKVGGLSAACP